MELSTIENIGILLILINAIIWVISFSNLMKVSKLENQIKWLCFAIDELEAENEKRNQEKA